MDASVKQRWIEALRSGKYKQGHSQLKTSGGTYCCLGVLRQVLEGEFIADPTDLYLTERLRKQADLSVIEMKDLANRNDGALPHQKRQTFAQIADYIEANL